MNYCRSLYSVFILVVLAVGYTSCSEDDSEKVAGPGLMIAKVDGQAWSSSTAVALIYDGQISVTGEQADGSQIVLSVAGSAAGTFPISGALSALYGNTASFTPVAANATTNPTFSSTFTPEITSGDIIITEIDETNKTISGTFHSKMVRFAPEEKQIAVTSGSFSKIPYEDDPGNLSENSFSVNVIGWPFIALNIGGVSSGGNLILNFYGAGAKAIAVVVPSETATGTFSFGTVGSDYYATYSQGSSVYESVSGTVVITSHDKTNDRIVGTFSFTGEFFLTGGGNISVTDGSFNVSY